MKYIPVLLSIAFLAACGGQEKAKPAEEEVNFFPVTTFIKGQIHIVDSLQSLTMAYVTNGNKTDTASITLQQFDELAAEFTKPDFNDSTVRKYYKESSFADQSIKAVVLNYSTTKEDLEVRKIDVVVDADAVQSDKVRSIYMEKQSHVQDTFIYKKLYWRTDKNFQIVTTKQWGGKPGTVHVIKVEWN